MTSPPLDLIGWAVDLTRAAGFPTTVENLAAVVAWARAEGGHNGNAAAYNPLNTTLARPGSRTINGAGVRAYPSRAVGIEATVATIRLAHYTRVVAAFTTNAGATRIADAVGSSPWGTSGALMARIIPSARAAVNASSSALTAAGGGAAAVAVSTGGALAGPARPKVLPDVDLGPRLGRIRLNNGRLAADVVDAVTAAKLSVAATEATTLDLTLEDAGGRLLASGLFAGRPLVDYGPLRLEVAKVEANGGAAGEGGLSVSCQPRGIGILRRTKGPLLAANVSPSELAGFWARRAGLLLIAEPSARRATIGIAGPSSPGEEGETVWSALNRWAQELGFICYEAAGVLYFGRPTWLMGQLHPNPIAWRGPKTDPRILSRPTCSRSVNVTPTEVEVSVEVHPSLLDVGHWYAGSLLALTGIPTFDSWYLVTGIDLDLASDASPATITAVNPVDPEPEPPESPSSTDGSSPSFTASSSSGAGAGGWVHPLKGAGRNAHNFGQQRTNPPHMHAGTDIGAGVGTPIYAARAGRVTYCAAAGSYGNLVKIAHAGGIETRYAHQSRFATRVGADVRAGDLIGYVGNTGRSTGPHLHFEVRVGGTAKNPDGYIG